MTIGAGALWGQAYKKLIDGRHDGWMVNGGRCPPVGTTGFILGGGLGPFTRTFGMACDSLIEATLVTADGEVVTVSGSDDPDSDKGKLFWALRGAGGGNFGVVVEMKIKVHKMKNKDGSLVAGLYTWFPQPGNTKLLRTTMTKLYTTDWPERMTIDSSWLCDFRRYPTGKASRTARSATAFDWREAVFHTYIQIGWDGKWLEGEMRDFAQTFKERLRPFSLEGRATFFNFPDGALKTDYHEQAYWGDNHEKLQQVKQIWDKDNYFDSVQGVRLPHANATMAAPSVDVNVQELTDGIASLQWDHHNRLPIYSLYSTYMDALQESFGISFVD